MSFFDRVGEFFDKTKDWATGPVDKDLNIPSAVGAAWSAASNWKVDDNSWFAKPANPIHWLMKPVEDASQNIVSGASDALNFAYSYGFARNASTANQMITYAVDGNALKLTSPEAWQEAYNRSANITLGQSAFTADAAIASKLSGTEIGPAWMKKNVDPYGPLAAADREDFFRNNWWGKLSSGAIDAVGTVAADPGYLAIKVGHAAQLAKVTVESADRGAVLAKAAEVGNRKATKGFDVGVKPSRTLQDGTQLTRKQADQGQRASQLIDRIVATPRREIQAMPELQGHEDANSLAILMERAKETYADDPKMQRQAIADVLGTAWGDMDSMTRLTARRDQLALDQERIVSPPPQNQWAWRAPNYQPIYDQAGVRAVAAQRKAIDDELSRLDDVIQHSGQALGPSRVGSTAIERAAEVSSLRAINESWLHTGFASAPVRMVTSMAGTRIPDHINIKDASAGYSDMVNTLRLMRYTDAPTKQKIMDSFVRASTPAHRMNVVDFTRDQIVKDAARKYGLSEDAAKALIQTGNGRMETVRNRLKSRLYSAAGDARFIQENDPEDDVIHAFDKPFLKSMLEDAHPIVDPREVEDAIKIASRSRLLDNAGAPGTFVADGFGTVKDAGLDVMNMATKAWKTSALARGAYPLRIMTDTQARQMVHMETQVFMATRKTSIKGLGTWLMSHKDSDTNGFRNIFKEGDLEKSVTEMLTRDLGMGSMWNLTPEDVPQIVRTVLSNNGGIADLSDEVANTLLRKRRTGDYSAIDPTSKDWTQAYLRAVNQQILNSPVALQALATPDIHELTRLVRSKPELMKEARDVGAKYDKHEEWLQTVIAANNHLLPTPELRIMAMNRGTLKPRVPKAETERIYNVRKANDEKLRSLTAQEKELKVLQSRGEDVSDQMGRISVERENALLVRHKVKGMLRRLNEDPANLRQGKFDEHEVTAIFGGKNPKVPPMPVHGEGFSVEKQGDFVGTYNKVRNGFFNVMAEMPENILGRSPLFWDSYRKQIALAVDRLSEEQIDLIGVDVIRKNAMKAARKQVGQILFDSSHSSNMASSMRFLSPFFSAWEDTMTKWGKLFYDQPELFARVNQGSQALYDGGWIQDQNGNRVAYDGHSYKNDGTRADLSKTYEPGAESIYLPHRFAKFLGSEGGVQIRKDSINSVFQGEPWWLPGFGPAVAIPVNRITRELFPKEVNNPIIKYILPYGTTTDSELKQLEPKYIKSWSNALGNSYEHQNQYRIFLAEAVIDERNGGPKVDLDKIANKTRNYFLLKGAVDNISPVSITPTPKNQFYIDKAHEYRADPNRKDWQADFDKDFPGFGEMKLELSANQTGIQATDAAFDAQKRYRKDIEKDPENGWLYVGPANAPGVYNGAVHDWQVSHGYRTQKDPVQALKDLQAGDGWQKYSQMRTLVNLELEKRGLVSIQQKGADDLQFIMKEYRNFLAGQNQAWADDYNATAGGGNNKPQALLDHAEAFMKEHKEARTRPDMVALQKYIAMRNAVKAQLATRDNKSLLYNPDLKYVMDAYTQSLVQDNYGFEQMFNRVLEYDNLEGDVK